MGLHVPAKVSHHFVFVSRYISCPRGLASLHYPQVFLDSVCSYLGLHVSNLI